MTAVYHSIDDIKSLKVAAVGGTGEFATIEDEQAHINSVIANPLPIVEDFEERSTHLGQDWIVKISGKPSLAYDVDHPQDLFWSYQVKSSGPA